MEDTKDKNEFAKTAYGKFIGATLIFTCVLLFVGLSILGFKSVCYSKGVDIDIYQRLFSLGDTYLEFGFWSIVLCTCAYSLANHKEKEDKIKGQKVLQYAVLILLIIYYLAAFAKVGFILGIF